jgi:hypothetical protein
MMEDTNRLKNVEDKLAIQSVIAEYCLRLEVSDFEEWLDLFTEDCTYEIFRKTLRGRAEVAAMLSQAPGGVHLGGPLRIELDGDKAKTVQNYLFIDANKSDWNMGWYHRDLVKTEVGWKIQRMVLKMHK